MFDVIGVSCCCCANIIADVQNTACQRRHCCEISEEAFIADLEPWGQLCDYTENWAVDKQFANFSLDCQQKNQENKEFSMVMLKGKYSKSLKN